MTLEPIPPNLHQSAARATRLSSPHWQRPPLNPLEPSVEPNSSPGSQHLPPFSAEPPPLPPRQPQPLPAPSSPARTPPPPPPPNTHLEEPVPLQTLPRDPLLPPASLPRP